MKMRKYTQDDIDALLYNFDVTDKKHHQGIADLNVIAIIDAFTPNKYDINRKQLNSVTYKLMDYLTIDRDDAGEEVLKEDPIYLESYEKLSEAFEIQKVLTRLDRDQGIRNFNYESNIWRIAFLLKSVQLSEEEESQGKRPTNPNDLIKNFTKSDFDSIKLTYEKLINICVTTEGTIGYLRLLQDASGIYDIKRLINKFTLDMELFDMLHGEVFNAEKKIYLNITKSNGDTDEREINQVDIDSLFLGTKKDYQPLLDIPMIYDYLLSEDAYHRVASDCKNLSFLELTHNITPITEKFRREILSE